MNLISQNCIASYITKNLLKEEFSNPFCWCVIDYISFKNLIEKWDYINFDNFILERDDHWNFSIIIDSLVKVQYVHYKFDATCKVLTHSNTISQELYWDHIWEYIVEKYKTRLKRMKERNEKPLFLIGNLNTTYRSSVFTDEQINYLSKYNNVIITKDIDKFPLRYALKNASEETYKNLMNII